MEENKIGNETEIGSGSGSGLESGEVEDSSSEIDEKEETEISSNPIPYSSLTGNQGDNTNLAGRASAVRAIITKCRISSGE